MTTADRDIGQESEGLGGQLEGGEREAAAARREGLITLFVWVDRDVPPDPTMTFGAELCDVVIPNRGTLEEFHRRLAALAAWARLFQR